MSANVSADRGAIESIIEDVLAAHWRRASGLTYNTPDTCSCGTRTLPEPGDAEIGERRARAFAKHQTRRILDRLAADGCSVVKTETLASGYNPVLNPEAIGDPAATPRVFVGPALRDLLRPCACGGVNGFHRDDCAEGSEDEQ